MSEENIEIIDDGETVAYYKDGLYHREDGPALVTMDGFEHWYLNGKRHRIGGPAIIGPGVGEEWWEDGVLHREGGPAVDHKKGDGKEGTKLWYHRGELHRKDGPAKLYADGSEMWLYEGKLHRRDGPALINTRDDVKKWFVSGQEMSEEEYISWRHKEEKFMRNKSARSTIA